MSEAKKPDGPQIECIFESGNMINPESRVKAVKGDRFKLSHEDAIRLRNSFSNKSEIEQKLGLSKPVETDVEITPKEDNKKKDAPQL